MANSVVTWDWKEQVDVDQLNRALRDAGFTGSVHEVFTNSDQYALVVSDKEITEDEALELWHQEMNYGD